jgi:hypothetical protein
MTMTMINQSRWAKSLTAPEQSAWLRLDQIKYLRLEEDPMATDPSVGDTQDPSFGDARLPTHEMAFQMDPSVTINFNNIINGSRNLNNSLLNNSFRKIDPIASTKVNNIIRNNSLKKTDPTVWMKRVALLVFLMRDENADRQFDWLRSGH